MPCSFQYRPIIKYPTDNWNAVASGSLSMHNETPADGSECGNVCDILSTSMEYISDMYSLNSNSYWNIYRAFSGGKSSHTSWYSYLCIYFLSHYKHNLQCSLTGMYCMWPTQSTKATLLSYGKTMIHIFTILSPVQPAEVTLFINKVHLCVIWDQYMKQYPQLWTSQGDCWKRKENRTTARKPVISVNQPTKLCHSMSKLIRQECNRPMETLITFIDRTT